MAFFNSAVKLKLIRALMSKNQPIYVQYYITARCNLHCQQCQIVYAQADSPEMNIRQIQKMAENLARIGVCMVLLIGGEPFLRRDLPQIIKAFVENDIHVRMQTNGLATRRMLEACVAAGGHDISISLDSLSNHVQDSINGVPRSWERALQAMSLVNQLFPDYGKAFLGTVLMPNNLDHIGHVLEFATATGWWMSLVPCHTTSPMRPLGFRTYDPEGSLSFKPEDYPRLMTVLAGLKELKRQGKHLYDCDEYLDDVGRFLTGHPVQWRRRNQNLCDSPNLYFAIEPNGRMQPCCDYKMTRNYPVYAEDFAHKYFSGEIQEHVMRYTRRCPGCMYGSYPEITLTARFLKPLVHRARLFNIGSLAGLKRYSKGELIDIARDIMREYRSGNEN